MKVPPQKKRIWPVVLTCVLSLVLVLLAVAAIFLNSLTLEIRLNGEEDLVLQYQENYEEPGAIATVSSRLFPQFSYVIPVELEQAPETIPLGENALSYQAQFLWLEASAQRTIFVVDGELPVITLVPDPPGKITYPGMAYEEEGYSAWDNHDGHITDQVQRTETETEIIYTVTDSSGNTTEVRRPIVYGDPEAPQLILNGDATIVLTMGNGFNDPGYTAMDNIDGDLTSQVQVEGTVNIFIPRTYTITYSVTDSFNNTTTVTREVQVVAPQNGEGFTPGSKVVYLTFDDGPYYYTERLLEILDKYNVKATFFVCDLSKHTAMLKKIVDAGHSIGVHSKTHDYQEIYASEEAYLADFNAMRQIIYEQTGVLTDIFRFPGGSSNSVSKFNPGIMTRLTKLMTELGYTYFDWNVTSGDAGAGADSVDLVFHNVVTGIQSRETALVLQHDINEYSVEAVESIIVWGLLNGCTFQALDENSPTFHHPINN